MNTPFRFGFAALTGHKSGGMFQYSQSMQQSLCRLQSYRQDEFLIVGDGRTGRLSAVRDPDGDYGAGQRVARRMARRLPGPVRQQLRRGVDRLTKQSTGPQLAFGDLCRAAGIDLVIHPAPTLASSEGNLPYVMAIHDLQHRLQPEFPEVSANGAWEAREHLFSTSIRDATLILTDSEVGREDVLAFYPDLIDADRVRALPFVVPPYLAGRPDDKECRRVRTAHRLPDRYLFYPAHFWPHKNHARIVEALAILRDDGVRVAAVFTGTSSGDPFREATFAEVTQLAQRLRVAEQLRLLDYVPARDMPALYAEATALVMPTFFGPTNIPVLEAWSLECPVITSDIRGIREQAGDGALLVDPRSSEAIAHAIRQVWEHDDVRRRLVERGGAWLSAYTTDDYDTRLNEILDQAKVLVLSAPLQAGGT